MHIRNKTHARPRSRLKKSVYLMTLCGLTTSSLANTFPTTPLHLQDETTTVSAAGVKPNIMLMIDDSGSMAYTTNGASTNDKSKQRMTITKNALNQVLDTYQNRVNWGIQTLWNNNKANYSGFTDNHNTIKSQVNKMSSSGGTPTTARYFHIQDIVRDNIKNRCQKSYIVLMSDGDSNLSCNGSKYNLRHFNLGEYVGKTSGMGDSNYNLIFSSLIKSEHINIFGNRTVGDSCQSWSGGSGITSWDRNDGLEWFSKTLYEKDLKTGGLDSKGGSWDDPKYPKQNIVTYTVGFGSGISDEGKRYLIKGASPCSGSSCPSYSYKINGITYKGSDKHYYNATEAEDLVDAFSQIFNDIDNENQSGSQQVFSATAPAISSNYIDGMAAAASLNTGSWSSELLFFNIDSDGHLDTSKPMRPSYANRKLLVSHGKESNQVYLYGSDQNSLSNAWFGIPNASGKSTPENATEWRDGLLKWLARQESDDAIRAQKNGAKLFQLDYRVRTTDAKQDQRAMGDIIDNSILSVGELANRRQEFVVTSTNDGLVYVFKSQNSATTPYDLAFNYAPAKMERHSNDGSDYVGKYYKDTTRDNYGSSSETNPHRYLLNGGMVARRTDVNGKGRQVFAASTMGQAGRGAFAINIGGRNRETGEPIAADNIHAENWHQEVKLFETPTGTDNQFGYTIGSPQIGRVQIKPYSNQTENDVHTNIHYGVFVSNGYQYSPNYASTMPTFQDTPSLYIYDALGQDVGLTPERSNYQKGDLLKKITIADGIGGLASPTLVDSNFDGVIDYVYAGDFGGGLYRFNLKSPNPDSWTATKIFQTPNNQPITSAPAVFRKGVNNYTVMVGTGTDIYQEDLDKRDRQAFYGVFDDLSQTNPSVITSNDLLEQTLTTEILQTTDGSEEVRKTSNKAIETRHKGWYVQLDANNGERITVKPSIMGNSVLLTTRVYEQEVIDSTGDDPCLDQTKHASSSAYSWLMQFSVANGGLISTNDKAVYIDFNLGDLAKFNLSNNNKTTSYVLSGQKLHNLTSITLIDRLMEGYSATSSGDSGGSGDDNILNPNAKTPKNYCVGDGSKAFTFNTGGESKTYDIHGACEPPVIGYKRLSWRELY